MPEKDARLGSDAEIPLRPARICARSGGFFLWRSGPGHFPEKQAGPGVRRRVAVAFVATPDGKTIAGYYTLSQYSVELGVLPEELAGKLPQYPLVPATLIGRLAVSVAFRGQGIGELLLMDALYRCLSGSRQVASAAVIPDVKVYAKDETPAAFYGKYGFLELSKVGSRLFLPMATIEARFG